MLGGRPSSTPSPSGDSGSISGGGIFIIILVVLLCAYLIIFMSINKYNGATGSDIWPHRLFWLSIPINTIYGIRFVFGKLTGKSSTYQSV